MKAKVCGNVFSVFWYHNSTRAFCASAVNVMREDAIKITKLSRYPTFEHINRARMHLKCSGDPACMHPCTSGSPAPIDDGPSRICAPSVEGKPPKTRANKLVFSVTMPSRSRCRFRGAPIFRKKLSNAQVRFNMCVISRSSYWKMCVVDVMSWRDLKALRLLYLKKLLY